MKTKTYQTNNSKNIRNKQQLHEFVKRRRNDKGMTKNEELKIDPSHRTQLDPQTRLSRA